MLQRRDRRGAPPAGATTPADADADADVNLLRLAARPRWRGLVRGRRRRRLQPAPAEELVRRAAPAHPELQLPARAEIQVDVLLLHERTHASHCGAAVLSRGSGAHCLLRRRAGRIEGRGRVNMGRQRQGFEKFYGQAMASGSGSVPGQGGIQENRMGGGGRQGPPCLGGSAQWLGLELDE